MPGFVVAGDVLIDKTVDLWSDQLMDAAHYVVSTHIELTIMLLTGEYLSSFFAIQVVE